MSALVATLRNPSARPEQLQQACAMIARSTGDDTRHDHIAARTEAAAVGVIEAVVAVMHEHSQHVDLQRDAAGVLWNLAAPSNDQAAIVSRMGACGAAAAVTNTLRTFLAVPAVCQNACAALQNMAGLPAIRASIGREGVATVTAALRVHGASAEVLQYALAALGRIVHGDADLQKHAVASGAHTFTVTALRTHPSHVGLQRFACNALQNLTQNAPENRTAVASTGAIEAIMTSMRTHGGVQAIQESACGALLNIGWDSPLLQSQIGPAATPLIKRALTVFPASGKLLERSAPVLAWVS